jgi:hypothetical protein
VKKTTHEHASKRFVDNLIAAFGRWKVTPDTIALYNEKLSKWHLTDDQWSRALSRIIADRPDNELPTLAVIYEYLKQAQAADVRRGEGMASMTFQDASGRPMAVRVKAEGGSWVNAPTSVGVRGGEQISLQAHPGCRPKLPEGALRVGVIPDKEAYAEDKSCSQAEALEAFTAGWQESDSDPAECERIVIAIQLQHRNRARKSGFVAIQDLLLPQPTALPAHPPPREIVEQVIEAEYVEEVPF